MSEGTKDQQQILKEATLHIAAEKGTANDITLVIILRAKDGTILYREPWEMGFGETLNLPMFQPREGVWSLSQK